MQHRTHPPTHTHTHTTVTHKKRTHLASSEGRDSQVEEQEEERGTQEGHGQRSRTEGGCSFAGSKILGKMFAWRKIVMTSYQDRKSPATFSLESYEAINLSHADVVVGRDCRGLRHRAANRGSSGPMRRPLLACERQPLGAGPLQKLLCGILGTGIDEQSCTTAVRSSPPPA